MANLTDVQTYPPRVPQTHPNQRWFHGADGERGISTYHGDYSMSEATVFRHGPVDAAEVEFRINVLGATGSNASTRLYYKPAQLRELAQRLLDAAADIEAHPSAELIANATLHRAGEPA